VIFIILFLLQMSVVGRQMSIVGGLQKSHGRGVAQEEEVERRSQDQEIEKDRTCDYQLKGGSEKGSEDRPVTKMGESISADVSGAGDGGGSQVGSSIGT
jgi:hypothetical protein